MHNCCCKTDDRPVIQLNSTSTPTDEGIFGYYNLVPDLPNFQPLPADNGCREWIPAGLQDKTFTLPIRPSGAYRPTCLWVGVPVISQSQSSRPRRQYRPQPHLARCLPYFETEQYLLRLPYRPPTRFYKPDLIDAPLVHPGDYIRWANAMKSKLMQSQTWRILEGDLEPVPPTSGLHAKWAQVNQHVWFLILANVSREIRREICEGYAWDVQGSWGSLVRLGRSPGTKHFGD
ncbi:hypothetical protein N7492_008890 [Penicillium capsulatum]|uniref:Uncharacterized protein n=1 Tax=Penicillium capsulatum TaxID=69766 RepID=A0A9W9LHJ4_9EURO|nr:hypothetical protein N7492_008890 [Penicillium capsulatum]KAJ6106292.1 hypothetical protein N7512_009809 [Penicillium capsulatum]